MKLQFPPDDSSKYRQWITKRTDELNENPVHSDVVDGFMVIVAAVCAFDLGNSPIRKTKVSAKEEDVVRFEAGCFLLANILKIMGPSFTEEQKKNYQVWLGSYFSISAGFFEIEADEFINIFDYRMRIYEEIFASGREASGALTELIVRSKNLTAPIVQIPETPSLSVDTAWVFPVVSIWITNYFAIVFRFLKEQPYYSK